VGLNPMKKVLLAFTLVEIMVCALLIDFLFAFKTLTVKSLDAKNQKPMAISIKPVCSI